MKIDIRDDGPVLCHCFKCNFGGFLNADMVDKLGLHIQIPKFKSHRKIQNTRSVSFKTVDEDDKKSIDEAVRYIGSRTGCYPSIEELKAFRFISNAHAYSMEYGLQFTKPPNFNGRYWFGLTNGNMVGRAKSSNAEMRWIKLSSTNIDSMNIYNIRVPFDLASPITVMISEGVMDSIGLYNISKGQNNIYISSLGKDYEAGLKYMINRGIYGDSVSVKIFKDSDVDTKSIKINKNLKSLFKKVEVWCNSAGHDYGDGIITLEKCLDWR